MDYNNFFKSKLNNLKDEGLYRTFREIDRHQNLFPKALEYNEGKNREVRKVMNYLGYNVNRLIRISFGPFNLKNLSAGELEEIKSRVLNDQLGLSKLKKIKQKKI